MMDVNGYSLEVERKIREEEKKDGTDEIMLPREILVAKETSPEKDTTERTSDPESTLRGKQPKPSNPEGSMDET
jgi:hypothetical protein